MEKKITVSFTHDELDYLCYTISLHEFNDDDEVIVGNKEHYIFLMNMSYKLVKRFETSGYITTNTRILKSNADYIKQLLK